MTSLVRCVVAFWQPWRQGRGPHPGHSLGHNVTLTDLVDTMDKQQLKKLIAVQLRWRCLQCAESCYDWHGAGLDLVSSMLAGGWAA